MYNGHRENLTEMEIRKAFQINGHEGRLFNKAELLAKHKDSTVTMTFDQQLRFIDVIHGLGQIRTKVPSIDEKISEYAWDLNDLINELKPPKV